MLGVFWIWTRSERRALLSEGETVTHWGANMHDAS